MIKNCNISRAARTVLTGAFLAVTSLAAAPAAASEDQELIHVAAADCYGVGQSVAASSGGQLAKAVPATRGGQAVCVIVVLVPGKDGGRPRRKEVVVKQ